MAQTLGLKMCWLQLLKSHRVVTRKVNIGVTIHAGDLKQVFIFLANIMFLSKM